MKLVMIIQCYESKEGYSAEMYCENSWDDGKQRLEESFKLTVFDKFMANGSGEGDLEP